MATKQGQSRWRQKQRTKGLRQFNVMLPDTAREAFLTLAKAVQQGEDVWAAMRRLGEDRLGKDQPPPVTQDPPKQPEQETEAQPPTKPKLRYSWKT